MFGLKKMKTTSEVINDFTQQFQEIVDYQQGEYDKALAAKKAAIVKMAEAEGEKSLAQTAIDNFKGMFSCSKAS